MASEIDRLPQSQDSRPPTADDGAPPEPPATANGKPAATLTNSEVIPVATSAAHNVSGTITNDVSASSAGNSNGDATGAGADSSSMASRTVPPITSPPYWQMNSMRNDGNPLRRHTSHNRTASAESVLPPGAITLQDNEDVSSDAGANGDASGRDRNRACWARSVEVVNHVVVNGSATNIGAFVVWNIRVETLSGSFMNIRKRYSEFDDFRARLVQTFPSFEAAVPELPPKSVISKFRPRFLEKRRAGLQYFLNCILLNPEFSGSPVLKDFLFS